jgi:hypothetical protein
LAKKKSKLPTGTSEETCLPPTSEARFKYGDRVYYTDPDADSSSGFGKITKIQGEDEPDWKPEDFDEAVIFLFMDDGSNVECFARELTKVKTVGMVQGALTRLEWCGLVEVPEDMEDNDVINRIYEHVCGGEYYKDDSYWERGEGHLVPPEQINEADTKPRYEIAPKGDIKYRGPTAPSKDYPLIFDVTEELVEAGATEADRGETDPGPFNNVDRALRALQGVRAFWGSDGNDCIKSIIGDLVCDTQHLARMLDIDWEELVAKSGRCNAEEIQGGV